MGIDWQKDNKRFLWEVNQFKIKVKFNILLHVPQACEWQFIKLDAEPHINYFLAHQEISSAISNLFIHLLLL